MVILDYDLLKDNGNFLKPMVSSKTMANFCTETLKKSFLECEKNCFKKDLPALPPREYFMFILLIILLSKKTLFCKLIPN